MERSGLTILHVSDTQLGDYHQFGEGIDARASNLYRESFAGSMTMAFRPLTCLSFPATLLRKVWRQGAITDTTGRRAVRPVLVECGSMPIEAG
jgi:hypothetical protein